MNKYNHVILITLTCLSVIALTSCNSPDWGAFGAEYISSKSDVRSFTRIDKYKSDIQEYTIHIPEVKNGVYPPYILRNGKLFILFQFGVNGKRRFYYPSSGDMDNLKKVFPELVDESKDCLGIEWLKKKPRMQVSEEEDWVIYEQEKAYKLFVSRQVGKFCDE